jgi:hypothetical protein
MTYLQCRKQLALAAEDMSVNGKGRKWGRQSPTSSQMSLLEIKLMEH